MKIIFVSIMKRYLLFLLIPLIFFSIRINQPLIRESDVNSTLYALYAKNIVRFSPNIHKFTNIKAVSSQALPEVENEPLKYYLDHPPLITWLAAINVKLIGDIAISYRLVPIVSSLISWLFLVKIGLLLKLNSGILTIFSFLLAINPLYIEHGEILNFEPTTLALLSVSFYFFLKYLKSPLKKFMISWLFFWALSMFSDWPAFFAAIPFIWLAATQKRKWASAISVILPILIIGLIFMWSYKINPTFLISFIQTPFQSDFLQRIQSINFLRNQFNLAWMNLTPFTMLFTAIGFLLIIFNINKYRQFLSFLIFFGTIGVLNVVLFPGWSVTHRFWTYYLIPAFLMLAAIAINELLILKQLKSFKAILMLLGSIIYLFLATQSIHQRITPLAISLNDWHNINSFKTKFPSANRIIAKKNYFTSLEGLMLRYHLDAQLTVKPDYDFNQPDIPMLIEQSDLCPYQAVSLSKSFKLCVQNET